ncbi:MAG: alanine:cation symporter family protein, partial [Pseudomonadota bacterium]
MEFLESVFGLIGDLTWGWALIPFLVIFGLFLTIATNFVQFRYFKRMFRVLSGDNQSNDPNNISAREALFVSVGGRVGGGNIAGVAVAITLGGPGAVFWMWMIALVGMATSLVECTLAQVFKRKQEDGSYRGGPARMIMYGLGKEFRWLAILYAICLIAAFGIGFPAFQGNTVAGAAENSFGLSRFITGAALTLGTGFIVFGGIQRIAKASDVIVPVMALSYILMAIIVIVINFTEI